MRSFPPEVFHCDYESLLFARFGRGRGAVRLTASKGYGLPAETFTPGMLTPVLAEPAGVVEALQRARREHGRIDRASLLLPDSWFRIGVLDLPSLPERKSEADEMVRWSLKKSLPARAEEFRVAHQMVRHSGEGAKVLIVAALEKTIVALEHAFSQAQIDLVLIEPAGLNLWNTISVHEPATNGDRVFFYLRKREFTTALFRAGSPMFFRSRPIGDERSLEQEVRLSASYFRANLQSAHVERCYVAAEDANGLMSTIASEFGAEARAVTLGEYVVADPAAATRGHEAELTACAGVFTS